MVGHGVGILLLSAVAGYWVLERAAKQKRRLQQFGYLVGGFIILVSLLGTVCAVLCAVQCDGRSGGMCAMIGGKKSYGRGMCPFSGHKRDLGAAPEQESPDYNNDAREPGEQRELHPQ